MSTKIDAAMAALKNCITSGKPWTRDMNEVYEAALLEVEEFKKLALELKSRPDQQAVTDTAGDNAEPVSRDEQLRRWVRAAEDFEVLRYEEIVMWGVSFNVEDETQPPVALFEREEDARAYATMFNRQEWAIEPYVLSMVGRNHFDVPEATT